MIKKFVGPLATTFSQKLRNIIFTYVILMVFIGLMLHLYKFLYSYGIGQINSPFESSGPGFWYKFFVNCIETPIWEEFVFRVFPIALVIGLSKGLGKAFGQFMLPYVIVLTSIIFGWGHGGCEYIYLQGVAGLMLTRLYIKNNNSFYSIVTVHFMWNLTVLIISTIPQR